MIDNVNDPSLNGKYLGTITADFLKVSDLLKEASYQVKARKISDFPIIVMSKNLLEIGMNIIEISKSKTQWNYNLAYLELLIIEKVIKNEAIENFKGAYKNVDEYCCLLVLDNEFNNFVYIPYPID